ncbi:MAG TPA: c-type cytochrome [Anaeromyxobacteraceae bacterium]|nr:c-type cytochrome [Anaeromyxobacteraceae bacterium]
MRPALLLGLALPATLVLAPACAAAQANALERGAEVAQRFCYACHDGEEKPGQNPLLPRLDERRFGSPADAYSSIGRLAEVNGAMTLPFSGTDEDRRALAAWLADAAQRGARARGAPARRAVGLAIGVTGAAIFVALRGRKRRAP